MAINIGELSQLSDFLDSYPENHWQARFYCGTSACAAGWAVALNAGCTVGTQFTESIASPGLLPMMKSRLLHSHHQNASAVADRAQRILGLSRYEASKLFFETMYRDYPEQSARDLIRALMAREKEELNPSQERLLRSFLVNRQPSWAQSDYDG